MKYKVILYILIFMFFFGCAFPRSNTQIFKNNDDQTNELVGIAEIDLERCTENKEGEMFFDSGASGVAFDLLVYGIKKLFESESGKYKNVIGTSTELAGDVFSYDGNMWGLKKERAFMLYRFVERNNIPECKSDKSCLENRKMNLALKKLPIASSNTNFKEFMSEIESAINPYVIYNNAGNEACKQEEKQVVEERDSCFEYRNNEDSFWGSLKQPVLQFAAIIILSPHPKDKSLFMVELVSYYYPATSAKAMYKIPLTNVHKVESVLSVNLSGPKGDVIYPSGSYSTSQIVFNVSWNREAAGKGRDVVWEKPPNREGQKIFRSPQMADGLVFSWKLTEGSDFEKVFKSASEEIGKIELSDLKSED